MRIAIVAMAAALSSCATVEPVGRQPSVVQEISERNYEVGKPYATVVGDALVRVRQYFVEQSDVSSVQANTDFAVRGGGYDISFKKGQVVPIAGSHISGGVRYFIVPVETTQLGMMAATLSLLVAEDGRINSKALDGGFIYSYRAEPLEGRLSPVQHTEVVRSKPFSNYEIIFNGSDGQAMRFTYREYSPDDLARTAFFQDLSYPVSAKVIRFRHLSLDVVGLDEQAITAIVRSD